MKKVVITLARQHGSGGLKIAKRLAEELGICCYDSEMFRLVSNDEAMHDNLVAHDARIKDTHLFDVAKATYEEHPDDELREQDELILMRNMFEYQSDIIRKLAKQESCVIVGRCANYILKDREDTISVFIHAPMEFRLRRASSIHNLPEKELEAYVRNTDERRANYYHSYTGGNWLDASNYELSLDSSLFGISGCAEMIEKYLKIRFPGWED